MRIFDWARSEISELPKDVVLTIGVFDGVHVGHQALIRKVIDNPFAARSLVVTFRNHPLRILRPDNYPGDILSLDDKIARLSSFGIQEVLLIDFSPEFSKLTGADFVGKIYTFFRPHMLVLGKNFRCGYQNDTDAEKVRKLLEPNGVRVDLVEPVLDSGAWVSSTRVRAAIVAGDIVTARRLLGSDYFLSLGRFDVQEEDGNYVVVAQSIKQVLPADGVFDVTMCERPLSFRVDESPTDETPSCQRQVRARVWIEKGVLRWPVTVGRDFTYIRFDRLVAARKNATHRMSAINGNHPDFPSGIRRRQEI